MCASTGSLVPESLESVRHIIAYRIAAKGQPQYTSIVKPLSGLLVKKARRE